MQKYRKLKENCSKYEVGKLVRGKEIFREKFLKEDEKVIERNPNR
jgi:hypothetical protein